MKKKPIIGIIERFSHIQRNGKDIIEILLLFLGFYLPVYFAAKLGDQNISSYMLQYILTVVPQILLILYILWIRKAPPLHHFGFVSLRRVDILYLVSLFACIFILFIGLQSLVSILGEDAQERILSGYRWQIPKASLLPLAFCFSIVTGYREEIFFRSYLITRFTGLGVPTIPTLLIATLVYSAGHVYQGWLGAIFTFLQGIFFSIFFIKRRNVHILALAHGLYNFTVLAMSILISDIPAT
jgi:membrane protease YdiL (CAAX protease family)